MVVKDKASSGLDPMNLILLRLLGSQDQTKELWMGGPNLSHRDEADVDKAII